MIQIKKLESTDNIRDLKQQYIELTTAPLDGMWLTGFVPMAIHYGFYQDDQVIGFCCLNDEGYLLQFYLSPSNNQREASQLFNLILGQRNSPIGKVNGAFVSTAEPRYLSLCLDSFTKFEVNALMYQLENNSIPSRVSDHTMHLTTVGSKQLAEVVDFAVTAIGAPEQWLTGYFTNLINRQELFCYVQNGRLVATGECRGYTEYQINFADLGVIVDRSQRTKGLGSQVINQLIRISKTRGLEPICSTESSNIGAQKAISRAGFYAENRILQFDY